MLPLRDDIQSKSFPIVTIGLIIMNVAIYFYQVTLHPMELQLLIAEFGFIPQRLTLATSLDPFITLFSSAFFHGNFFHLAGNMLYLWIFGDNVEDRLGKFRFILFYLLAALFGNIGHYLSDPLSIQPAIGASGAVAGILGAYMIYYPRARILTLVPLGIIFTVIHIPALLFLGIWILLQSINALMPIAGEALSVAWWAHIGGFLMGMVHATFKRVREE